MAQVAPDTTETRDLLERLRAGDRGALDQLLSLHRSFLRRLIELRLDPRLRARVDPSDVVQKTQLEAARRIDDYLRRGPMPFRLWLRMTAEKRLNALWRQHMAAARRSIGCEPSLDGRSSVQLAERLLVGGPSPSEQVRSRELARMVRQAVAQLGDPDREIVVMRNFEELSNEEVAYTLGVDPGTASKRYGRALLRLHKILLELGLRGSQL
ncbi:MAG: sigma-70 family RNA polymerase sigma factor [Planctomycetes bacterium]|nr:sigma-70 family RNA polymerase sigma factor [Planctomycetota bacterium]